LFYYFVQINILNDIYMAMHIGSAISVITGLAAGIAIITATIVVYFGGFLPREPEQPMTPSPRIEIEGLHERYLVGEHLNFTVQTSGACNTPNVIIANNNVAIFEYSSQPIHCGPPDNDPFTPRINWSAEQLGRADLILEKTGNYTLTASVYDKNVTVGFVVDYSTVAKKAVGATASLPEVMAFLKVYPDSTIKVSPVGERTLQVSYVKEVYSTNYDNNNTAATGSSSIVIGNGSSGNGSINDKNNSNSNNDATRGRSISLAVTVDSITLNPSNSVVSCYPINEGVDADSARGANMIPFILESKTRCFGRVIR
jgi:hypothetical protein